MEERKIIKNCVTCTCASASMSIQIMADPPPPLLEWNMCISLLQEPIVLGLKDLILCKFRKGRGIKSFTYSIFICFCTHAIHIELVSDLSTQALFSLSQKICIQKRKAKRNCKWLCKKFCWCDQGVEKKYTKL